MEKEISVSSPQIGAEEMAAVQKVLESSYIAEGPEVAKLEDGFAAYCGAEYAVALNSGTAALHAALHSLDIGKGDSVITSPFTFIASVNPILVQGAEVKFVDIEPDTFNINTSKLNAAYDKSVKAILPVDLYGQPANYSEIWDFANKHKVAVVEDACQSIGAEYKGKRTGTLGHIACFSLYATKNITSAEGGMLLTDSKEVANTAKAFRQHGMVAPYEYAGVGYNYRSNDILAAIGSVQLNKAERFNAKRSANAERLTDGLANVGGLKLPQLLDGVKSAWHQYTVRVSEEFPISREELINRLKQKGIGTAVYYPKPLHYYEHIKKLGFTEGDFPEAEKAAREVLSLPIHPGLSSEDIDHVVKCVMDIANG